MWVRQVYHNTIVCIHHGYNARSFLKRTAEIKYSSMWFHAINADSFTRVRVVHSVANDLVVHVSEYVLCSVKHTLSSRSEFFSWRRDRRQNKTVRVMFGPYRVLGKKPYILLRPRNHILELNTKSWNALSHHPLPFFCCPSVSCLGRCGNTRITSTTATPAPTTSVSVFPPRSKHYYWWYYCYFNFCYCYYYCYCF